MNQHTRCHVFVFRCALCICVCGMCVIKIQHFDGISSTHVLVIASIDVRCRCVCMLASPIWSPHYRGHGQRQGQRSVVWIPMGGKRIRKGMGKRGRMPCAKCSCINLYTDSHSSTYIHMYTCTHIQPVNCTFTSQG
jgi:hypothetical protein